MISQHARAGLPQALSEAVATFGLICTILGTGRHRVAAVPIAVAAYTGFSTLYDRGSRGRHRAIRRCSCGVRPSCESAGFRHGRCSKIELSRRLRNIGRLETVSANVEVSGRCSLTRPLLLRDDHERAAALCRLGVPPETLARAYRDVP